MSREISLIRKEYCLKRKITEVSALTFMHQRVNRVTGNQVFSACATGMVPELYEHVRVDVSSFALNKSLGIPVEMQKNRDVLLNKSNMASWINKHMNVNLLPEDIGFLVIGQKGLTVVISPNSMRFQNSFIIYFL